MSDDFEYDLRSGFLDEAGQMLQDVEQCFLVLEQNPNDAPTLEKIFRLAHNIKGSSKAVGFDGLGAFTHEFESFLLKCKSGEIPITAATVSLLLKCVDHLNQFVAGLRDNHAFGMDGTQLIQEMHNFKGEAVESEPLIEEAHESAEMNAQETNEETFSVEDVQALQRADAEVLAEFDRQMNEPAAPSFDTIESTVRESIAAPVVAAPAAVAPPTPTPALTVVPPVVESSAAAAPPSGNSPSANNGQQADETIRVSLSRLEKLLNFVGEMVILQTVLKEQSYSDNPVLLRRTIHQMGKVTKEVQDLSMSLRMVPLKQTFQKMQRVVRDTSSALNKKVNLVIEGEETEVDKTVLEALGDPLVHLVRNACDHGIEEPENRVQAGKSETGTVILRAFHQSGKLVIEIRDNGGGISANRLRQKATEKGILKPGQQISDQEAVHLIFHPGFSTKAVVTEVSGRGVGMDVVKTNIEQMQGEVLVETVEGQGSVFKIVLPLTLAIIDGMVVRSGEERFVIPLSHVHESVKPKPEDLQFATGVGEVLFLRGENLPVIRISQALGKLKKAKTDQEHIAIIVRTQGAPFAALVDDIIGQHQVVIKKLGAEIQNMSGYSGSAILGDGKPALILELGELALKYPKSKQGAA
jgi:two-component system chemotaxis sensor kinase CheA